MVEHLVAALRYKPAGRGLIPGGVIEMPYLQFSRPHYGPRVDSASNRNEYQEYFVEVKVAGA